MRYEASLMGNIEQALQGLLGYEEQAAEAGPTRFGETLADVDLIMEEPTTGERAFVQVKSKATQAILDDYLDRFRVRVRSVLLRMPLHQGHSKVAR